MARRDQDHVRRSKNLGFMVLSRVSERADEHAGDVGVVVEDMRIPAGWGRRRSAGGGCGKSENRARGRETTREFKHIERQICTDETLGTKRRGAMNLLRGIQSNDSRVQITGHF